MHSFLYDLLDIFMWLRTENSLKWITPEKLWDAPILWYFFQPGWFIPRQFKGTRDWMSRLPISFGCSTAKPGNVGAAAKGRSRLRSLGSGGWQEDMVLALWDPKLATVKCKVGIASLGPPASMLSTAKASLFTFNIDRHWCPNVLSHT